MCDKGHKDMSYHKESDGDLQVDSLTKCYNTKQAATTVRQWASVATYAYISNPLYL